MGLEGCCVLSESIWTFSASPIYEKMGYERFNEKSVEGRNFFSMKKLSDKTNAHGQNKAAPLRYAEISPGYLRKDKWFLVIKGGKLARRSAIPLALCFGVG